MSSSKPAAPAAGTANVRTKGHCSCRAISYEFEGAPKWVMHCHCESCRRATSSAVATYVGVKLEQFQYLQGEPSFWDSSPGVKRYFCGTCGTPMAYVGERWAGQVHLFHGTLEDPSQWPPTGHAYVEEQVPWFDAHDSLPRYSATAGRGATPVRHGPRHG
jgi:hypothetical protein